MDSIHKYNLKGELVEPWEDGYYSVTTILDIRHMHKLWQWRMSVGWEEANRKGKEAAELGNKVHKYIHGELTGDWGLQEYTADMQPYVKGWENWQEKVEPETIDSELFLISHRHKYAGTGDWVGMINGELWIVDYKSGSKSINHGLQLAAYRQAYKEMTGKIAKTACLYLTPKTNKGWQWRVYNEPVKPFLAAKTLFDWQVKHEPHRKPETAYVGGMLYVTDSAV